MNIHYTTVSTTQYTLYQSLRQQGQPPPPFPPLLQKTQTFLPAYMYFVVYHQFPHGASPQEGRGRGRVNDFRLIFGQFILTFEAEANVTHI